MEGCYDCERRADEGREDRKVGLAGGVGDGGASAKPREGKSWLLA